MSAAAGRINEGICAAWTWEGLLMALARNSEAGWIGGVCAGLAGTSGLSVVLLRAAFVLVPGAFLVYPVLWVLLPDES